MLFLSGVIIVSYIVIVGIMFRVTIWIGKRQLRTSKKTKNVYTLSQRYQLQENLRMIAVIRRIIYRLVKKKYGTMSLWNLQLTNKIGDITRFLFILSPFNLLSKN